MCAGYATCTSQFWSTQCTFAMQQMSPLGTKLYADQPHLPWSLFLFCWLISCWWQPAQHSAGLATAAAPPEASELLESCIRRRLEQYAAAGSTSALEVMAQTPQHQGQAGALVLCSEQTAD